ncbi:LTA synthase family protein [Hymenobacter sp. GOD-10R]|uniref:LTA synthase family protein n=1 Tax=Hymenobacter sp. GOD-10R TaxID=3093922 RepID=UPI002D771DF8|nr:LTA synthase family protein [Hymenobacter sp. GOD-10R]WRQ26830.1 LTA synthase family protein [Hymenobacter sp. GOD-10R]
MPSLALRLLLRRFSMLLGLYLLLRIGFYVANHDVFREASSGQVLWAFWHGFRFDIAGLLLLNLPFVVLSLVPAFGRNWQRALRGIYLVLNSVGLALNIVDTEYFKFIGRRTSNELSTIGSDVSRQAVQLLGHYWYLLIPFIALMLLLGYLYPMPGQQPAVSATSAKPLQRFGWQAVEVALVALAVVLGIRGGLQLKPLRTGHAFVQQPALLGHLALNSTFTFLKSLGYQPAEHKQYFASPAALRHALAARPLPARSAMGAPLRDNVVVLLLESFASEYTGIENNGQGYTPFFDSLATKSLFFREHYANGRRSIEALPAVLAGLPSLMEGPFITSNYQTDELHGLGEVLGRQGYTTSMFHGAQNGTMGFNTFAGIAGVQRYYGLSEYPGGANSPDYDGHWGIFDEPYLQYFSQQLGKQPEPFFSTLFTLSSHEPFTVPAQYQGRFPAGDLPIHATIGYTDNALRKFFAAASRQPWYKHTLFILLADHTSQTSRAGYQNALGSYKTPLLLFHPGRQLPAADVHRITQQADVPATVLDYLGLRANRQLLPFGYSVFDQGTTGRALYLSGGSYFLVHRDLVTELTADNQVLLYPYQTHTISTESLPHPDVRRVQQYGDELKACVQFFVNGLSDNQLYKAGN